MGNDGIRDVARSWGRRNDGTLPGAASVEQLAVSAVEAEPTEPEAEVSNAVSSRLVRFLALEDLLIPRATPSTVSLCATDDGAT